LRLALRPPGAIRERFTGRNLRCRWPSHSDIALLEFSQARLFQPCFFGQFQLSFPAPPCGYLDPPVTFANSKAPLLMGGREKRGLLAQVMDDTRPCRYLAPQTWSVLDFVRTNLRTLRLAIAGGDHSNSTMQPIASRDGPHHPFVVNESRQLEEGHAGVGHRGVVLISDAPVVAQNLSFFGLYQPQQTIDGREA
jgi:hypothetical protein